MIRRQFQFYLAGAAAVAVSVAATAALSMRGWTGAPAVEVTGAALSAPVRTGVIALAERYVSHAWTADARHVFHGQDPAGIRIDTPDGGFGEGKDDSDGWWRPGERSVGIPYKWGGFDTPESFDAGLQQGKFAGDVYTAEKRRLLDDGVSAAAIGIDCSGFVSRCWELPRSYSTRELPDLCDPVDDIDDLRPGDILNTHNRHVRLFGGWEDRAAGKAVFYEAARRVQRKVYDIDEMIRNGYQLWRYRGMREK